MATMLLSEVQLVTRQGRLYDSVFTRLQYELKQQHMCHEHCSAQNLFPYWGRVWRAGVFGAFA